MDPVTFDVSKNSGREWYTVFDVSKRTRNCEHEVQLFRKGKNNEILTPTVKTNASSHIMS